MLIPNTGYLDLIIILSGALILDLILGEPPLPIHPVVWMGKFTSLWAKAGLTRRPAIQFAWGTAMTLLSLGLFAVPAYYLLYYVKSWYHVLFLILGAMLLKTTFSLNELRRAALKIRHLLDQNKLAEARFWLRALVKRDARDLNEPLVVSAAAESVAENLCDSLVAPLFYFLLLGIPGAVAYRVSNTLDAMIGLHGRYEYLGKFAARLDDALNWIPARLSAIMIIIAALIYRKNARMAWLIMRRDHALTASPNAGWPMSAAAGALEVSFTKTRHYTLGDARRPLVPGTINSAVNLITISALIWFAFCILLEVLCFALKT